MIVVDSWCTAIYGKSIIHIYLRTIISESSAAKQMNKLIRSNNQGKDHSFKFEMTYKQGVHYKVGALVDNWWCTLQTISPAIFNIGA